MSLALVLPGAVAVVVAVAAGYVPWWRSPTAALRVLTLVAVTTALTVMAVLLSAAAGLASRLGLAPSLVEWCPLLTPHHQVGFGEGTAAVLLLGAGLVRGTQVLRRHRWARAGTAGQSLVVLEDDNPVAYAAPGKPGCVVVSKGLLRSLDSGQRQIVFAHERAHLAQHHHRYLLAGAVARAVLPLLARLVAQIELAAERCADEAAVVATGGDRRAVATTIGKAALATTSMAGAPGFGGSTVLDRVTALLDPKESATASLKTGAIVVSAAILIGATVQVHHLYGLIDHICGR